MDYLKVAKAQFLKDYSLKEFPTEEIYIQKSIPFTDESMGYLSGTPFLNFVYFGTQLFISADSRIYDFASAYAKRCRHDLFRVFDAPNIFHLNNELEKYGFTVAHLAQYFLLDANKNVKADNSYPLEILCKEQIEALYGLGFDMALCGTIKGRRHDVMAVVCRIDNQIVGVAGCSSDGKDMWQIGVDVLPQFQKKGIGTALVVRLSEEILKLGKCPFYCCAWSNLASKRLARRAGFIDGWVELSAKSIEEDWIKKIRMLEG
ncbi:MAG: GNAT family N-acetyltransferase [Anaeroplasmataceae bacterium]|nr:GNAT family N-acetyltransferase [Anaeroplasmataceae bacterium]MDE6414098.1 GNAT family N-acetyltransferase [Anaeroplasmataceae bacterium]